MQRNTFSRGSTTLWIIAAAIVLSAGAAAYFISRSQSSTSAVQIPVTPITVDQTVPTTPSSETSPSTPAVSASTPCEYLSAASVSSALGVEVTAAIDREDNVINCMYSSSGNNEVANNI